jgi:hypothetical protein
MYRTVFCSESSVECGHIFCDIRVHFHLLSLPLYATEITLRPLDGHTQLEREEILKYERNLR